MLKAVKHIGGLPMGSVRRFSKTTRRRSCPIPTRLMEEFDHPQNRARFFDRRFDYLVLALAAAMIDYPLHGA
jgi:hypothetical protein